MHSTNSTRLQRLESHRTYTETLLQSFYQLKQTTRDHVELVYGLTMRQQDFPETDSYCRIQQALRFLGANIATKTDPEDLLIAWVHKRNKAAFNFTQESDRDELKSQAARSLWTYHELKVITAEWMQGKDEDRLVRMGECAMQISAKHAARRPPDGIDQPHDTIPLKSRAHIRQAWDQSTARNSYLRLGDSLLTLGVDKGEISRLMNWLREQNGLSWSQMLQKRWELTHLELIAGMWTRDGGPRTLNGAPLLENGQQGLGTADPCLAKREKPGELPSLHQGAGMQEEGGGDEIDAEEEVVRDDFTVRVGDSTTLDLIAAVTKAHDAARKANEDANNAYNAVAQRTAELVTNLLQQPDRTGCPVVMPGRYLEPARHVSYPWRSRTKRRK